MHHTPRASRMSRPAPARWLPAALAALAVVVFAQVPAAAETDPTITWAVSPAASDGPDDRAWMELTLDPGQSVTEHLAVTNLSEVEATFSLSAADGYFTSTGRFNMLPSSEPSTAAGTWIDVAESLTVEAGETEVVPFTIVVPSSATPGDHAAGIAASVFTEGEDEAGAAVGVESRVGFRVLTRVTGDLEPSVAVEDLDVSYRTSWNPFAPGRVTVEHEVVNDGNARIRVVGEIVVQDSTSPLLWEAGAAEPPELLPGDARPVTAEVHGVWPLFRVGVDVVLRPEMLGDEDGPQPVAEIREHVTVWAVPWSQLVLLLALATAVVVVRRSRRQREARLAAMIEAAKAEVRRELGAGGTDREDHAAHAADADADAAAEQPARSEDETVSDERVTGPLG
ncbi:WxL protein peptidoglycan domain-containing protein [Georgenia sp. MJ170]|uniref:WxL protein peptidoglycan domain-containing protein n=1 Tax=Georgenia sunbinii TaxID=3117728 RepID=UPI002F26DEC7